jgi:hypothetical protein
MVFFPDNPNQMTYNQAQPGELTRDYQERDAIRIVVLILFETVVSIASLAAALGLVRLGVNPLEKDVSRSRSELNERHQMI